MQKQSGRPGTRSYVASSFSLSFFFVSPGSCGSSVPRGSPRHFPSPDSVAVSHIFYVHCCLVSAKQVRSLSATVPSAGARFRVNLGLGLSFSPQIAGAVLVASWRTTSWLQPGTQARIKDDFKGPCEKLKWKTIVKDIFSSFNMSVFALRTLQVPKMTTWWVGFAQVTALFKLRSAFHVTSQPDYCSIASVDFIFLKVTAWALVAIFPLLALA